LDSLAAFLLDSLAAFLLDSLAAALAIDLRCWFPIIPNVVINNKKSIVIEIMALLCFIVDHFPV
ncbi:hypothetical protein EFL64_10125, partial [Weissella cibaria]|nr:hypothetical protein [Weissella cibaria]